MEDQSLLSQRIAGAYGAMSKSHKRIAQYIQTNYDKAAYMTAAQMGEATGASESTVVRFAASLGYEGYPHLQKALQETVRNKLTLLQRMELTSSMASADVLKTVLKADISNLRHTLEDIDMRCFERMVEEICQARRVYVLGARSSAPVAQFVGYYLNFMLPQVTTVTSGVSDILEQLMHIGPGDVLLGISFPRYSKRTVDGMQYAREKGALVLAVTDSHSSPLAACSDFVLPVRSNIATFVDSLVAPFSIANALVAAISTKLQSESSGYFQALEDIWDKYDVYLEKTNDRL